MAWTVNGNYWQMCEGDFGIALPVTIDDVTFSAQDAVKFVVKDRTNGNTILEKEFTNIDRSTVNIELTSAETASLPAGSYVFSLDWYQNGHFMCNIIPIGGFRVVEKA